MYSIGLHDYDSNILPLGYGGAAFAFRWRLYVPIPRHSAMMGTWKKQTSHAYDYTVGRRHS
jgi:hypothetical protein